MSSATHITLVLALNDDYVFINDIISRGQLPYHEISDLIDDVAGGLRRGKLLYHIDRADGAQATNDVTFTAASGVDGDTVTVCGIVLTARTSPSLDVAKGEFGIGATDTETAVNFKNAVNSHPLLDGLVSAANTAGVVDLTITEGGLHGNLGTLATSNAVFAAVGAATFASGAAGTKVKDLTVDPDCRNIA